MTATLVSSSVYEDPAYLAASAAHEGAGLVWVGDGGLELALLRRPDGALRTVYGLPRPVGEGSPAELAGRLATLGSPLTAVLSPLGAGGQLARALVDAGGTIVGRRDISVADLAGGDPAAAIASRTRRAIRVALRRGAQVRVTPLTPWFGAFYRAAMAELEAAPIYFFADDYFDALTRVDHYQVTVEDADGPAAAALFIRGGGETYYHLGGRRAGDAVPGAMNLALAQGLRHGGEAGDLVGVLGGGRTDAPDDSLLAFKRQLAPQLRPRLTVAVGGEGAA